MNPVQKLAKLKKIILKLDSGLIAFSGGLDSTFLLRVAAEVLPKHKILAVTATSVTYPPEELSFSKSIARRLGVRHKIIRTDELSNKRFAANTINRCYFCKKELFSRMQDIARRQKLNYVVDASNISDQDDFRPGDKAKKEFKVRSPLQEAGLTKPDIRKLSRSLGLQTWNKPQLACLASRIPYGVGISAPLLKRINEAEKFLRDIGFKQARLRHYNGLCRIEVSKGDILKLARKRRLIVEGLKRLGYNYITLDLEGYRQGSMNEVINK